MAGSADEPFTRYDDGMIALDLPSGFTVIAEAGDGNRIYSIRAERFGGRYLSEQISVSIGDVRQLAFLGPTTIPGKWIDAPKPGIRSTTPLPDGREQRRSHTWMVTTPARTRAEFNQACQASGAWYASLSWQIYDQTIIDPARFERILASLGLDQEALRHPAEAVARRAAEKERRQVERERIFTAWAMTTAPGGAGAPATPARTVVAEPGPAAAVAAGEAAYADGTVSLVHPLDFKVTLNRSGDEGLHAVHGKRGRGKSEERFSLSFGKTCSPHSIFPDLLAEYGSLQPEWLSVPGAAGPRMRQVNRDRGKVRTDLIEHSWLPLHPALRPEDWRGRCFEPESFVASLSWYRAGAEIDLAQFERLWASIRVLDPAGLAARAAAEARKEAAQWLAARSGKTGDAEAVDAAPDAALLVPGRRCAIDYDHGQLLVHDHPDQVLEIPLPTAAHIRQGFVRREHAIYFVTIGVDGDGVLTLETGPYRGEAGDQRVIAVSLHSRSGEIWCHGLEEGPRRKWVGPPGWYRITLAQRRNDDESADFRLFAEPIAEPGPSVVLRADAGLRPGKRLIETVDALTS